MKNKNKAHHRHSPFRVLRRIDENHVLWAVIVAVFGVDALWARVAGLKFVPSMRAGLALCVLTSMQLVYSTIRPNRRLAVLTAATAQLGAVTVSAVILNYLAATSKFPLIDQPLAAADARVGLDWLALFYWLQNHPAVDLILCLAYYSLLMQIGILLVALSVLGKFDRMREFIWVWSATLLIIILLAWFVPAEGAWAYYGVTNLVDAYYLPHLYAMRAGKMPEIVLDAAVGLIQFPSFHAAASLILMYAARGIRILFPVYAGINILMISSTPTWGGHHFSDVLAGLAVAFCVIAVSRRFWNEPQAR